MAKEALPAAVSSQLVAEPEPEAEVKAPAPAAAGQCWTEQHTDLDWFAAKMELLPPSPSRPEEVHLVTNDSHCHQACFQHREGQLQGKGGDLRRGLVPKSCPARATHSCVGCAASHTQAAGSWRAVL